MSHSGNIKLVPGAFYRDLDGTRVRLVRISRELCSWAPVGDAGCQLQITHEANFRLRFRRWRDEEMEPKSDEHAA